jgi:hypothetical protein
MRAQEHPNPKLTPNETRHDVQDLRPRSKSFLGELRLGKEFQCQSV